ncbi:MAG: hypothetical protein OET18_08085, partial [Desulfobacterales bacterium]|nr:hypothetical protein [Desulfobacterales bacterium]
AKPSVLYLEPFFVICVNQRNLRIVLSFTYLQNLRTALSFTYLRKSAKSVDNVLKMRPKKL